MTGKWLWIGLIASGALLLALATVGISGVGAGEKSAALSQYVGSQACLGCHLDKHDTWSETGHAEMLVRVFKPADLPGNAAAAPAELKPELARAQYVVAGQRFIARDAKTGELSYLNVQYDAAKKAYVPYKGGASWEQGCAGCHATGWVKPEASFAEASIGCESCHGPGRAHVAGKGDRSKIALSTDAITCGVCHNGGAKADGTRWPDGWKPGMKLEDVGFNLTALPKDGSVPAAAQHLRQYAPALASGHLEAADKPLTTKHDNPACYTCHSAEARIAAAKGKPITNLEYLRNTTDGVSCVACHDPHQQTAFPAQLRMAPETLCASCHTASLAEGKTFTPGAEVHHPHKEMLAGVGAIGIEPTRGVHTRDEISCVACHMTEGNHMFKVILPKTVAGTNRQDSCVACHDKSTAVIRGAYLDMWQETTTQKLETVQAKLLRAEGMLKQNPATPAALADKVKLARTNFSFVEADGSRGAHNFEYAMKALEAADRALSEFFTPAK